jgi:hypothetical protein
MSKVRCIGLDVHARVRQRRSVALAPIHGALQMSSAAPQTCAQMYDKSHFFGRLIILPCSLVLAP